MRRMRRVPGAVIRHPCSQWISDWRHAARMAQMSEVYEV